MLKWISPGRTFNLLTSRGTEALVALEDSAPDVLFESLPGSNVLIWPQIRMSFAVATAETELNAIAVPAVMPRRQVIARLLKAYLPNADSPDRIRGHKKYCFFASGVTVRNTPHGVDNWLVGAFATALAGQSAIIQDRPLPRKPARPSFRDTYTFDYAHTRVDLSTRRGPLSDETISRLREVVREVARELPFPLSSDQIRTIEGRAVTRLSRARHLDAESMRVLDQVEPEVVFMDGASYGDRASFISRMKDRGITVIEPQHGWIGPSHGAYNFGSAMSAPELKKTLPDVLMTFGDFWSGLVRHPATVVSIGKPHLEEMASHTPSLNQRPNSVLVVSSASETKEMAAFTLSLRDALPSNWTVRFRPHPSERPSLRERYPSLVDAPRVEFDQNSDVYESLLQVRGVVGVASTVLYEALAMGCHVFVKDSPFAAYYIDDVFGELITDAASIAKMVKIITESESPLHSSSSLASIWKPNAVVNFVSQLSEL